MKSNRTAVKALRSGCGKCSERGLGPCADGIAAAKKKMETRGPGGRRSGSRAVFSGRLRGLGGGQPRGLSSGGGAVSAGGGLPWPVRGLYGRLRGFGGGQPRGLPSGGGAVSNGRCAVVRSGLQRRAGGCGPGMFPDGGSPGLRGWGGLREKEARNEGADRSGRFGRNSRNNRRGCSFAGPGRGVSGRQLSEDVSGRQ